MLLVKLYEFCSFYVKITSVASLAVRGCVYPNVSSGIIGVKANWLKMRNLSRAYSTSTGTQLSVAALQPVKVYLNASTQKENKGKAGVYR